MNKSLQSRNSERHESYLQRLIQNHALAAASLAGMTLLLGMAVSLARWPTPTVHDEFAYLLAADTFSEGRLANPPHPMWRHFETFHVIQHPTYAAKYPPGQGLLLAAGQLLTGWPLAGVWFSSALAVVCCYWMLLGWTSRVWAFVGGLICTTHTGLQLIWGQSYWGGALAMAGGALVIGGAMRMTHRRKALDAVAMATGAALLAVTRPFEGFVLCLVVGAWVLDNWLKQKGISWKQTLRRSVLPVTVGLAGLVVGLASYNFAVTGSVTTMPYSLHESVYGRAPLFLWQTPADERQYQHQELAVFHDFWSMDWFAKQQSIAGLFKKKMIMLGHVVKLYFPVVLAVPLLLLKPWRLGRVRGLVAVLLIAWLATQVTVWNFPHYVAPLAPLFVLLMVWGLRRLDIFAPRWLPRHALSASLIALHVFTFANVTNNYASMGQEGWQWERNRIAKQLSADDQRHLVIVKYEPGHHVYHEWVYNRADIDSSKIVWARSMSPKQNAELVDYFRGRKAWYLKADRKEPELQPYSQEIITLAVELARRAE
ncbi:MAG: hypothetical protein RH917_10010 [Lacipirellulaceae bacterium]